ncbi:NACHT domain-containing protein [Chloroflexota bacterium]
MDSRELAELLSRDEGLKLDFKREYQLHHAEPQVSESEWNELIKDILALANGNVGTARQKAYLIIGAGDELKPDGTRELFDVREQGLELDRQQILEKVNSYCWPPIPDLSYSELQIEGIWLAVIEIPPSPFVHETTQRLRVFDKAYSESTVFIRRGESIHPATQAERTQLESEKRRWLDTGIAGHRVGIAVGYSESATPAPRSRVADDEWRRYSDALTAALQLETERFGVRVDVVPNRVAPYSDRQPMEAAEEASPWLEVALGSKDESTVLLGEPGQGKTVCFTTLAQRLLEGFQDAEDSPLPIKVRLASYHESESSLAELIAQQLRYSGADIGPDEVPGILAERPFFVLLDGLNEVVDQIPLIRELNALISRATESRFLLSCRRANYGPVQERLRAHKAWSLQQFDREDIGTLLGEYSQAAEADARTMGSWLEDDQLVDVLGTPFYLSLFVTLDPSSHPSPRNRAELCQQFVTELQTRELKTRPELERVGLPWYLLEETALWMQEQHSTHVPMSDFEQVGQRSWLEQFYGHQTTSTLNESLQLLLSSPLLTDVAGKVAFRHQLFRDFFAARFLKRKADLSDSASFAQFVGDPWWDYTIVLLAGLLPDASQVLYNIVYEGTNYSLAIRCLRESKILNLQTFRDVVEWMRQDLRFGELITLSPLIASLPEEAREWSTAEAEAIFRTALATDDEVWGTGLYLSWHALRRSELPITEEVVLPIVAEALEGTNELARGNALPFAARAGQWDKVLEFVDDSSSYVRKMLAVALADAPFSNGDLQRSLGTLAKLSQDPVVEVRRSVMLTAGEFGDSTSWDILLQGLADPDEQVRIQALDSLRFAQAENELPSHVQDQAVPLLDDWIGEGAQGDELGEILSFLEAVETSESSDALFGAALTGYTNPAYVADVLASRGDPRALLAMTEAMLFSPKEYLNDLAWRASVQEKLSTFLEHPFELAWIEAVLIEDAAYREIRYHPPADETWLTRRLDPMVALETMVEVGTDSPAALHRFLWILLMGCNQLACYRGGSPALLDAVLHRLIEVDPCAFVEFIEDHGRQVDHGDWGLWIDISDFAARLLGSAVALIDALPEEERDRLLSRSSLLGKDAD